ncbi:MAG: 7-carboxy-7-deazaguanine synthase [Myxococcota bacterium]|nr:7-carboxy-7-deazaguanine synthase [Myxococcota bacterium]
MAYTVKETYLTLQGEGTHAGRAAVFCRFTGCNLWSGRERDRESSACSFCDTDFVGTDGPGGGRFASAPDLAAHIYEVWRARASGGKPYVVFTGGEPLLQLDQPLTDACKARGIEVGVETNGTRPLPSGVNWVCVSPKAGTKLVVRTGQELKLVFPQSGLRPEDVGGLAFDHFFLQPMDGPDQAANTRLAVDYCLRNPTWRLSLQTHKLIGIP